MAYLKSILYSLLVTIISCDNLQNNHSAPLPTSDTSALKIDTANLLAQNLYKHYPEFILKHDTLKFDTQKYADQQVPDTSKCSSFKYNRSFLGEVNNTPFFVKENRSTAKELYLQSGNLSLWVCNLPDKIIPGDTIFITGRIFDIHGNEKTWGYPTILTNVYTRK